MFPSDFIKNIHHELRIVRGIINVSNKLTLHADRDIASGMLRR